MVVVVFNTKLLGSLPKADYAICDISGWKTILTVGLEGSDLMLVILIFAGVH